MSDQPRGLSPEEAKHLITKDQVCGPDAKPPLDYPVIKHIGNALQGAGCYISDKLDKMEQAVTGGLNTSHDKAVIAEQKFQETLHIAPPPHQQQGGLSR